jgi:hypothetical protein
MDQGVQMDHHHELKTADAEVLVEREKYQAVL